MVTKTAGRLLLKDTGVQRTADVTASQCHTLVSIKKIWGVPIMGQWFKNLTAVAQVAAKAGYSGLKDPA